MPTTKSIGKKNLLFRISHRFYPTVRSGYDTYYGLNGPAVIFLSFEYGVLDNLSVSLGHSNYLHEFELAVRWDALSQNNFPVALSFSGGGSLITRPVPCESVWRQENLKMNWQGVVSRQVSDSFSALVAVLYSTNTKISDPLSENTLALGLGGRYMIFREFSLLGEWVPVVNGYKNLHDYLAFGFEYKIGGHVFQAVLTNATGMTTDTFVPGGDLDFGSNDYRLGFSIYRKFSF